VTTYADAQSADTPAPVSPRTIHAALRARLVSPMPTDRVTGWIASICVTLVAFGFRLYRLSLPAKEVFDEVHYRKDSHDIIRWGVERNAEGNGPGYVVHPPLGKWMLGVGQRLFDWDRSETYRKGLTGYHSAWSWRIASAVVGSLTILIMCRMARRLFRSTLLGCFAGMLMTLDGMHFVQSRVAMLDIMQLFWVMLAAACMLADRDQLRSRMASRLERRGDDPARYPGPRTGLRGWRVAAGVCIGCATGVKWNGAYLIVAFALLSFAWEVGARRTAGVPSPWRAALRQSAVPIVATLVILPVAVYIGTWAGWFITDDGWRRSCDPALMRPWSGMPKPKRCGPFWGLLQYHIEALKFHNSLTAKHAYESHTWGWLLLARPVSYYYTTPKPGYTRAILEVGTPAIWWPSIVALGATFWKWISARDWRAAYILTGFAAMYLPWFWNDMHSRTMFNFYALQSLPFLCLALTYGAGLVLGPAKASLERAFWGATAVGAYLLLVMVNFYYLYPILAAKIIPYTDWRHRIWFQSWI
jgi:dolichyl-phosphate-mannose--protein O-mannosyl transferase